MKNKVILTLLGMVLFVSFAGCGNKTPAETGSLPAVSVDAMLLDAGVFTAFMVFTNPDSEKFKALDEHILNSFSPGVYGDAWNKLAAEGRLFAEDLSRIRIMHTLKGEIEYCLRWADYDDETGSFVPGVTFFTEYMLSP
jgi:hypothetical protein